jgi:hypothetical protein
MKVAAPIRYTTKVEDYEMVAMRLTRLNQVFMIRELQCVKNDGNDQSYSVTILIPHFPREIQWLAN